MRARFPRQRLVESAPNLEGRPAVPTARATSTATVTMNVYRYWNDGILL